jgi:hypothetical protein
MKADLPRMAMDEPVRLARRSFVDPPWVLDELGCEVRHEAGRDLEPPSREEEREPRVPKVGIDTRRQIGELHRVRRSGPKLEIIRKRPSRAFARDLEQSVSLEPALGAFAMAFPVGGVLARRPLAWRSHLGWIIRRHYA